MPAITIRVRKALTGIILNGNLPGLGLINTSGVAERCPGHEEAAHRDPRRLHDFERILMISGIPIGWNALLEPFAKLLLGLFLKRTSVLPI